MLFSPKPGDVVLVDGNDIPNDPVMRYGLGQ